MQTPINTKPISFSLFVLAIGNLNYFDRVSETLLTIFNAKSGMYIDIIGVKALKRLKMQHTCMYWASI